MVKVEVRAPLHATEVRERVEQAVSAFWPDMNLDVADGQIVGHSSSMDAFRDRVWELRIIDTVRGQVLHRCKGNATDFWLSKQAALHGHISFPPGPHALGELDVRITIEEGDPWADADAFTWWMCPETEDGKIVDQGSHK